MSSDNALHCRHSLDRQHIERIKNLLKNLPREFPEILEQYEIDAYDYEAAFHSAVQSIRGTFAATISIKKRFYSAVLDRMKETEQIVDWEFIGTGRSQDYRVVLPGEYVVGIEAKGCPDGNNIRIWQRPTWAREFIIWSQCPDSLQHHPGRGVASGISRLFRKAVLENQGVDAFVFFDGRCGSDIRRCPKGYGIEGELRSKATKIAGQDGKDWIPPPCIYLFPSTIAHPISNPKPEVHNTTSCRFAAAMLSAFRVPESDHRGNLYWVRHELQQRPDGVYGRFSVGWNLDNSDPSFNSQWNRIASE